MNHSNRSILRTIALPLLLGALLPFHLARAEFTSQEANIARVTAGLLKESHFTAKSSTEDISAKFLDHYLDMFDPARLYFFQSDLAEFAPYRNTLAELTLTDGDLSPAQKIFDRYLARLDQRVDFVTNELLVASFDFTSDETYRFDRKDAPRPTNLDDGRQLWRQQLRHEYLLEKLADKKHEDIVKSLAKRYERTQRTMKQFDSHRVFEAYLTALARVYDPHSDYMGRQQLEDFRINMSLSLFGIGAVLRSEDGYCKIMELMTGGPAETSKQLSPGDTIIAVAQDGADPIDVVEMPLRDIVAMIRGPKGTKVNLTIQPAKASDSERRVITLVRDEIKLEKQEAKARIIDMPTETAKSTRIGIVSLPSFYVGDSKTKDKNGSGATADVAKLIEKLKTENIQGLILDLRRNGGGSLEEAVRLTGLFIKSGPVVQTVNSGGMVSTLRDPDASALYDGPLVVLTSRISASASEILAGAIQDYGRGLVVGDQSTFGKGTVQSVINLGPIMEKNKLDGGEQPGALKLTIRKFYRPSGLSTQLKGVEPDLVIPSHLSQLKIGEREMKTALPWDEIPPTMYTRVDKVISYVADIKAMSDTRIAADQEFQWMAEDNTRVKQRTNNESISLNEQKRRNETSEDNARDKQRDAIRTKNAPPNETQYEITLRNAGTPGLPDPMTLGTNTISSAAVSAPSNNGNSQNPGVIPDPDNEDDSNDVQPDPVLHETKRILLDYIRVLAGPLDPATAPVVQETR
jgi:carboxyl-terminal processing protease